MPAFSKKTAKQKDNSLAIEQERAKEVDDLKEKLKLAEGKLAQLEGIQSAMPDPYYIRDMDYNIVLWPDAIAKLTGYSEAEAKKMKCYDIFKAGVCPPGNACPTQQCITTRQFLRDVAVDVYGKGGGTIHSLVSNAGVYDDAGNPIAAVEVVKDNTVVQNTMDSIGKTIKEIEEVSNKLIDAMEKVHSTSQRVNENATESLSEIKSGVQTGNRVSEKAGDSTKHANSVQGNMKSINDSMKFSVDKILSLREKSEKIIEFIKIIQDISSKTNLLAINASIEAAHAGESGRGFKVVADGIRELSKTSHESAASIQQAVREINAMVGETTTSLNVTEKDIEAGTNTISDLLTFVGDIATAINDLMYMVHSIESTASTTSQLIGEQNESVTEVSGVGTQLAGIAKELTAEFDRVFKAIQHTDMA